MNLNNAVKTYIQLQEEKDRIKNDLEAKINPLKNMIKAQELESEPLVKKIDKKMEGILKKIEGEVSSIEASEIALKEGVIKKRKSKAIIFEKDPKEIIKNLKKKNLSYCYTVTEVVDKQALKKLDDKVLEEIGAKRLHKNNIKIVKK